LNFNEILSGSSPKLVCINTDTKKRGLLLYLFLLSLIVRDYTSANSGAIVAIDVVDAIGVVNVVDIKYVVDIIGIQQIFGSKVAVQQLQKNLS
jgi:hypothetical protein